jgi:hypothetical protein
MSLYVIAILILFILIVTFYWDLWIGKCTKSQISKMYNVTRLTFNNWVRLFHTEQNYMSWLKLKRISEVNFTSLKKTLGDPEMIIMNKTDMCEKFSTNHKYLRKIILIRGHQIGITEELWDSCSVFPPRISMELKI